MYDIGKALGHSSPSTTSKIYTHLLDPEITKTFWSECGEVRRSRKKSRTEPANKRFLLCALFHIYHNIYHKQ